MSSPPSFPTPTAPTTTTTTITTYVYWMELMTTDVAVFTSYVLSLSILCELRSPKSDWSYDQKVKFEFLTLNRSGIDVDELKGNGYDI